MHGKSRRSLAAVLGCLMLSAVCGARAADAGAPAPTAVAANIRQVLKEQYPTIQVDSIHPGPISGLYEVVAGNEILYTTASADLVFVGHVVDTRSKEDLSVAHWNEYNRIDFAALPLELAVKRVKGDGSRTLAVFEDPKCPFCKELERQIEPITNVTMYVFLYPLEQVHPGATDMADRIWCAKDRPGAWDSWMLKGAEPPSVPVDCDVTAIARLRALGATLRIMSTPTLFFSDGRRVRGTMSAQQLESELARTGAAVASTAAASQ